MANASMLSGLSPVRYINGNYWNGAVNIYCVLPADTNAYFIGDCVTTIGNANADGNGIPAVTLAAAGGAIRGVIVGIGTSAIGSGPYINPNNLGTLSRPSGAQTSTYYLAVCDDPDVLFEIQEGGAGSVLLATSVNRNVNINTGTRTGTLNVSPAFLDNNTVNTTATLNLKIVSAVLRIDNTPFTAFQKWLVKINNHEYSGGTTSP